MMTSAVHYDRLCENVPKMPQQFSSSIQKRYPEP
jgi:hypothetical protein